MVSFVDQEFPGGLILLNAVTSFSQPVAERSADFHIPDNQKSFDPLFFCHHLLRPSATGTFNESLPLTGV